LRHAAPTSRKTAATRGLQYQLGRALAYSGAIDEALPMLDSAAKSAYPQAQFVLADLLLEGRTASPVDRCRALGLLRESAAQRRMAAQVGLAAWHLGGSFGRCGNAADAGRVAGPSCRARASRSPGSTRCCSSRISNGSCALQDPDATRSECARNPSSRTAALSARDG
jgi:hypothetical protein